MHTYDVFNGDADGICALIQLRLIHHSTRLSDKPNGLWPRPLPFFGLCALESASIRPGSLRSSIIDPICLGVLNNEPYYRCVPRK